MAFESVRGYVQLASGLGELTRARAMDAAQGLLSLPNVGGATGKVAGQVGVLAEEILAAALANRENLTALVRNEVDLAVSRLGLVPTVELERARDEVARLRAEVSRLREATIGRITTTAAATPAAASAGTTAATSPPPEPSAPVRKARSPRAAVKAGSGPRTAADRAAAKAAAATWSEAPVVAAAAALSSNSWRR